MIIEDFLEAVLPSTGHLCCTTIASGRAVQSFHPTVTSLATAIRAADAQGLETYFGCASYATPSSRKATNALAARALWVDIDVGPGKPYPELSDALVALREYVAVVQIGVPLVVGSGGGIHCYWPLDRDVPAAEWQTLAAAFKASLKSHGLHADPSRTADIASILRPPGTFNRKYTPPIEIVVMRESDIYTVSTIRSALAIEAVEVSSGNIYSPTDCAENAQLGGAAVEYGPSSAERIAEACGVIVEAVGQGDAFADQMRQTALAARMIAIGRIAVGDEKAKESFADEITDRLGMTAGDPVDGGRRTQGDPQPAQLAALRPGGFVGVDDAGHAQVGE